MNESTVQESDCVSFWQELGEREREQEKNQLAEKGERESE